eukprot:CAMPEP_0113513436 /NCGR_PEP_ID=MMETSP0014_2-20120614/39863_1 /TAXON_ID=2857 /ORGANISM="Nitzschia sp." /LENGTH=555 /DNA_ID=CAMNT_0000409843 /DNA_START=131 /DNA_END=1798 /DNA_ORIENTATION=- /assembly_acc=CAM_ASM_000159
MDSSTSRTMKKKPPQNIGIATGAGASADTTAGTATEDGEIIYKPTQYDVLLGRGRPFQSWNGNKRLHTVVDMYKPRYTNAKRHEKTEMAEEIVMFIKSTGKEKVGRCGRFLRRVTLEEVRKQRAAAAAAAAAAGGGGGAPTAATAYIEGYDKHIAFLTDTSVVTSVGGGGWVEVSDLIARDKVSHALRGKAQETATISAAGGRDNPRIARSAPEDEKICPSQGRLKSTSRSTKTKAAVIKKKSGAKKGPKAPSKKSPVKAKRKKEQGTKFKTDPVVRKAVKPSSGVGSDTTYRSHTEAIVQDLLRRKQGSGGAQQSNQKTNDDSKIKAQELSQAGSLAPPPSGTGDRPQMMPSFGQQLVSFQQQQQQQQSTGGMNLPLQQFPQLNAQSFASSLSVDYLQELRVRNAMLERELALARLRGSAGLPAGLDPTSLAMNNGLAMGTNLTGNVQTAPFNMLPPAASVATASATFGANSNNSASIAAALRGIGGNPPASSGNTASMLPTSQLAVTPSIMPAPTNNISQLMASNQFLSNLRDDELLSLLSRSNNNNNTNNNS